MDAANTLVASSETGHSKSANILLPQLHEHVIHVRFRNVLPRSSSDGGLAKELENIQVLAEDGAVDLFLQGRHRDWNDNFVL
jgi:hypothetical protein